MNTTRIACTVSLASALGQKRSKFGDTSVEFSDEDIACLSSVARQCLAASDFRPGPGVHKELVPPTETGLGHYARLDVREATTLCVATNLEIRAEAWDNTRQERAAREAEEATRVAAQLAELKTLLAINPEVAGDDHAKHVQTLRCDILSCADPVLSEAREWEKRHEQVLKQRGIDAWLARAEVLFLIAPEAATQKQLNEASLCYQALPSELDKPIGVWRDAVRNHQEAVAQRAHDEAKARVIDARRAFVVEHGTLNQVARFDADRLPYDELLSIARIALIPRPIDASWPCFAPLTPLRVQGFRLQRLLDRGAVDDVRRHPYLVPQRQGRRDGARRFEQLEQRSRRRDATRCACSPARRRRGPDRTTGVRALSLTEADVAADRAADVAALIRYRLLDETVMHDAATARAIYEEAKIAATSILATSVLVGHKWSDADGLYELSMIPLRALQGKLGHEPTWREGRSLERCIRIYLAAGVVP